MSDIGVNQPVTDPRAQLLEYFPKDQMQVMQDLFAQTHQLAVVTTDLDGNWITNPSNFSTMCLILQGSLKVKERCDLTYQVVGETLREKVKLSWQECLSCGFVEAGVPILAGGVHVANCLVGQNNALKVTRQRMEEYAWLMEVDVLQVRNAYADMTCLPIEQFTKVLTLYSSYTCEVMQQAYHAYQLQLEVDRLRLLEASLRREGIELIQSSLMLRESINRMGRGLQDVLRTTNDWTDENDDLKLSVSDGPLEMQLGDTIQKIRQVYRLALDGMALEQAQRTEMESLLFGRPINSPKRRLARWSESKKIK